MNLCQIYFAKVRVKLKGNCMGINNFNTVYFLRGTAGFGFESGGRETENDNKWFDMSSNKGDFGSKIVDSVKLKL